MGPEESEWFDYENPQWFYYDEEFEEIWPTQKLLNATHDQVDWPSNPITMDQIRKQVKTDLELAKFFSADGHHLNLIRAESNLAFLIAQRIGGQRLEEYEEVDERDNLTVLYVIWSLEKDEAHAKARVDSLVANIEDVIYRTTGIPRPERPQKGPSTGENPNSFDHSP